MCCYNMRYNAAYVTMRIQTNLVKEPEIGFLPGHYCVNYFGYCGSPNMFNKFGYKPATMRGLIMFYR